MTLTRRFVTRLAPAVLALSLLGAPASTAAPYVSQSASAAVSSGITPAVPMYGDDLHITSVPPAPAGHRTVIWFYNQNGVMKGTGNNSMHVSGYVDLPGDRFRGCYHFDPDAYGQPDTEPVCTGFTGPTQYNPDRFVVDVSKKKVRPGQKISVTGYGYFFEALTFRLGTARATKTSDGPVYPNDYGPATVTMRVPKNLKPGKHVVSYTGGIKARGGKTKITVLPRR